MRRSLFDDEQGEYGEEYQTNLHQEYKQESKDQIQYALNFDELDISTEYGKGKECSSQIKYLDENTLKAISQYHQAREELELLEFIFLEEGIINAHIKREADQIQGTNEAENRLMKSIEEEISLLSKKQVGVQQQINERKNSNVQLIKSLENAENKRKQAVKEYQSIQNKHKSVYQTLGSRILLPDYMNLPSSQTLLGIVAHTTTLSKLKLEQLKEKIKKQKSILKQIKAQKQQLLKEYNKMLKASEASKNTYRPSFDKIFSQMKLINESTFLKSTENNENLNILNQQFFKVDKSKTPNNQKSIRSQKICKNTSKSTSKKKMGKKQKVNQS